MYSNSVFEHLAQMFTIILCVLYETLWNFISFLMRLDYDNDIGKIWN